MSQLTLCLLGPPRLEREGDQVYFPHRKSIALLAYLAVTGQTHSRDALAALLWPESDPSSARGGLRRMLSEIKSILGEGWLVTDRENVRFNAKSDLPIGKSFWLDFAVFQEKLKVCETHNHLPRVLCPECLLALEEATKLYQDDFMAGFSLKDCPAYDEWQFFQREESRSQLANALVRLSSHYEQVHEYETTIRYTRRWLVLDPLNEAAHKKLMVLYEEYGQHAAALRQYDNYQKILSDELGLEPADEIRFLYQSIQGSMSVSAGDFLYKSDLPVQPITFGTWLKSRRRQLDLTQKRLAYLANCSVSTIRKMESDERRPSLQLATNLAKHLSIAPDQLETFITFARSEPYSAGAPCPILPQNVSAKPFKFNLPHVTSPFLGREAELAALHEQFYNGNQRLVSIVGPGGIGKTRLALAYAHQIAQSISPTIARHPYLDGVVFVNLTPLPGVEHLVLALAEDLDFPILEGNREKRSARQQLLDYLRNRRLLLVLDNFEHLLYSPDMPDKQIEVNGADLVAEILRVAPEVRILVTSRERLNLHLEQVFDIDGLGFPDWEAISLGVGVEHLDAYPAVQLFLQTAQHCQPNFCLETQADRLALVRICHLVDGMPLALELAASWVDTLSLGDIVAELNKGIDLLETEMRDIPNRQRSMRATFDASWQKLDEKEQSVFAQISVFHGGFTREAVQTVTEATLRQLTRLVHKSFIQFNQQNDRYQVHELMRQCGAERLRLDSDIERSVLDRHSSYYCRKLASWQADIKGARQGKVIKEMRQDINNIETAWVWAVKNRKITELMSAIMTLCNHYIGQVKSIEGDRACQLVVDEMSKASKTAIKNPARKAEIMELMSLALMWQSLFNWTLGKLVVAHRQVRRGLFILENSELNTKNAQFIKAGLLNSLSFIIRHKSPMVADQLLKESLQICRSLKMNFHTSGLLENLDFHISVVLENLGNNAGSIDERIKYHEESLEIRRNQGYMLGIATSLLYLSSVAALQLKFDKAEEMAYEALTIFRESEQRNALVFLLTRLQSYLNWQGKFIESRSLMMETLAQYCDLGSLPSLALANSLAGYPDLYLGNYRAATKQCQYGLSLCGKVEHFWQSIGCANANIILGKVALAEGSYMEAQQWFQHSLSSLEKLRITLATKEQSFLGEALACTGLAARGMNQNGQARNRFLEALRAAMKFQEFLPLTHALPGIALLFADQGEIQRAVELYALASTFGIVANSNWFADIAGDEIAEAAEKLPADVIEATKARGGALDLWETAEKLLVELEELGWGNAGQQINNITTGV